MAPTSPTSGRRRRPCEAAIAALAVVLLALLMGSASASTYGGPSPAATSPNKFYTEQGFVRAEGKRFMVKDKPFYFQGRRGASE